MRRAADQAAEARTVVQQARDSLKELTRLDGSKVCRHCGQELTEGHLKEEKRRRTTAVAEAEAKLKQATQAHQAAQQSERQVRAEHDQAEAARQDLRVEYQALKEKADQAQAEASRLREECGQTYGELPPAFRVRVAASLPADWPATEYPTAPDLACAAGRGGRPVGGAAAVAAGGAGPRPVAQMDDAGGRQTPGIDCASARSCRTTRRRSAANTPGLEAEEKSLEKNLAARRLEWKEVESDMERLTKEREQAQSELGKCDAALKQQEFLQQEAQKTLARTRALLPPAWQAAAEKIGTSELFDWRARRRGWRRPTPTRRGRELHGARLNRDALRQAGRSWRGRRRRFPPRRGRSRRRWRRACRRPALRIGPPRRSCARRTATRTSSTTTARSGRTSRRNVGDKDGELSVQRTLAELLGKDRLQLYLVRQAERQVVEHANAVLDRLSGGQLYLKLSGEAEGDGATSKALELEAYNRETGEKPINVAFLSGSQKFRVAVSLALGIGQYASRQHRPIESVIIDEGFGCLDRHGRQVMIQELQNLRSQMRCILLVSHQEEFADAFSDGYHFELEGGATRVKRFQK